MHLAKTGIKTYSRREKPLCIYQKKKSILAFNNLRDHDTTIQNLKLNSFEIKKGLNIEVFIKKIANHHKYVV